MMWTVRRAAAADAVEIARINVNAWRRAYRGIVDDAFLDSMDPEQRVPGWERWIAAPGPSAVFVAADESGRIGSYAGVGAARSDDEDFPEPTGELYAIYADPDLWGTGAGGAVHRAGLRHLAESGFTTAVLWVLDDNALARNFYRSQGWQDDDVHKDIELNGARLPERRYSVRLRVDQPNNV
ncbi:GNAT family N-acetyltransferase [Allokutzneria sp. A3M-2-11 16]|uniref:GNAT family N-acetyltransferase n=1 Tax=Allokutzneria sp. A3M-2-11 16 TaxID=2962043 RepID=UPI0020B75520|nr:GNAT family N-acetyltransferase [Allokutzneria sp. A3M-2-11 16]MCP3802469.1 GNAT family N-acetyltransferase [Allokutzneria sp. A3M-2-11 16]